MPGLSQNPREVLNLVEDVVYGLSDLHSVSLSHSLLRHLQTFISLLFFKVLGPGCEALVACLVRIRLVRYALNACDCRCPAKRLVRRSNQACWS